MTTLENALRATSSRTHVFYREFPQIIHPLLQLNILVKITWCISYPLKGAGKVVLGGMIEDAYKLD